MKGIERVGNGVFFRMDGGASGPDTFYFDIRQLTINFQIYDAASGGAGDGGLKVSLAGGVSDGGSPLTFIGYGQFATEDLIEVADRDPNDITRWIWSESKIANLLSDDHQPIDQVKSPAGNMLVVIRKYLVNGKASIISSQVREAGSVRSDCYAMRFLNCGKNIVMIDDVPLDPNEVMDLPGEANVELITVFRVTFDDGSTGREIINKTTKKALSAVSAPASI